MTEKKKIFISYQRQHEQAISALVRALERDIKYDIWYDQKMDPGKWWEQILDEIEAADVIVLALSRSYLKSVPCQLEREYAQALGKAILPVNVDPRLNYDALPEDILELQINPYFGETSQFFELEATLQKLSSPPLPVPMPDRPPAPINTGSNFDNRLLAIGVVAAVIAIVVLGLSVNFIASAPTDTPTTETLVGGADDGTVVDNTPEPNAEPESGPYDLRLLYGERESFTILANATSNLSNVRLVSGDADILLSERFSDLAQMDYTIQPDTCLIFNLADTDTPTPFACTGPIFEAQIQANEIWWYDESQNQYNNVFLRRGEDAPQFCAHDNGSGNCPLSSDS